MPSWLITGANRGIGLATVQNLIQKKSHVVIATTRSDSPILNNLVTENKNLTVVILDITNPSTINAAITMITPLLPYGLDYLVNNAGKGWQPLTTFEEMDLNLFAEEMTLNTVDVLRISHAFLPLIKKSDLKRIIFISNILASSPITFMMVNQFNSYTVAKAALNMLAHKWGTALKNERILTAIIHPGWVQTDFGAHLTPWMTTHASHVPAISSEEATKNIIKISDNLSIEMTASFWNYDGTPLPW